MKNSFQDTFAFDKSVIESYINYNLDLFSKFKTSFNYIAGKLPTQSFSENLGELIWNKGKSYNWIVIQDDSITLIIRKYQRHFTIFVKNIIKRHDDEDDIYYYHTKYGVFTFYTNGYKIEYEDNDFFELDRYLKNLIEYLKEDHTHSLWNDYSFERDKHKEKKNIWKIF